MNSQDLLNIFLILCLLIITACILYTTYYFVKAVKSVNNLTDDLKGKVGLRALTALPSIMIALAGKFFKRRG